MLNPLTILPIPAFLSVFSTLSSISLTELVPLRVRSGVSGIEFISMWRPFNPGVGGLETLFERPF